MSEDLGINGHGQAVADDPLGPPPTPMPRAVVCPYCGHISGNAERCSGCGGRFDPLSRQATQNAMGPWFVLDPRSPTRPGCTYETMLQLIEKGSIRPDSVVRSPTTRQFWMLAKRVPGLANRFGVCHSCQAEVEPDAYMCNGCGVVFEVDRDRQHLGVGQVRLLAGQATPDHIAARDALSKPAAPAQESAVEEVPRKAAVESESARATEAAARVARLERQVRSLSSKLRVSALVTVAAVLALGTVVLMEQMRGEPTHIPRPIAQPSLADNETRTIETIGGGVGQANNEVLPVESEPERDPVEVVQQPPVDEVVVDENSWDYVRSRAVELYKSGQTADLEEAISLLNRLIDAGDSPIEATALRDRLADRLRQRKLDGLP